MENTDQLERIRTSDQKELLALAAESLQDPAAFKLKLDAWIRERECRKTALDSDVAELTALKADHRRLSPLDVAESRAASIMIENARSEGARNPAADFQALAEMAERARIKAAFIGSTVHTLVRRLIPRQDVKVKQAESYLAQAVTQVALHEVVSVLADFITLTEPLSREMGCSGIDTPPKVQFFLDNAVRAWRAERGASELLVVASTALAEMERATQQLSL